jgi:hypothetical protein
MKLKVQLVVCDNEGHEDTCTDVVVLENACRRGENGVSFSYPSRTPLAGLAGLPPMYPDGGYPRAGQAAF